MTQLSYDIKTVSIETWGWSRKQSIAAVVYKSIQL